MKDLLRHKLAAVCWSLAIWTCHAAPVTNTVTLLCDPPTLNEDGTAIAPGELTAYEWFRGPWAYTNGLAVAWGPRTQFSVTPGPSCNAVETNGVRTYYRVRCRNVDGAVSDMSGSLKRGVTKPVPTSVPRVK